MSFDPTSTQPGLSGTKAEGPKIIHMKCRRDGCKSMRATELGSQNQSENVGAAHNRMYRCVDCGNTWGVSTGGYVAI
jgi:DNA-directed RNA polymerase subunit M/transcription elongation factor TFIIS